MASRAKLLISKSAKGLSMRGVLRLLRLGNCLMSFIAVIIGAFVAVGLGILAVRWMSAAFAGFAAFLFTGAGNTLNDYFDADTDRINHPDRPIPRGEISREQAVRVASLFFVASVPLSLLASVDSFLLLTMNLAVMLSYETTFKRRGFIGNVQVSWLVASLFLFGGLSVYQWKIDAMSRIAVLSLLAFLSTVGREIVKDMADIRGDSDRVTLPRKIGSGRAGKIASAGFLGAVALSWIPVVFGLLSPYYYAVVFLADAIFIYCAIFTASKPQEISRVSKYAMSVALVAFLAGGIR